MTLTEQALAKIAAIERKEALEGIKGDPLVPLVKALIAYFDMPGSRPPGEIQCVEAETEAALKAFVEAK